MIKVFEHKAQHNTTGYINNKQDGYQGGILALQSQSITCSPVSHTIQLACSKIMKFWKVQRSINHKTTQFNN